VNRLLPGMIAVLLTVILTVTGSAASLDPWTIRVQPSFSAGMAPSWASGLTNAPALHADADAVEIPLPPLASQDEIGCFAATVLFDDNGDGGPVVEWTPRGGDRTLLSAGLGDTGVPLGINARTILLPQTVTLDGGTLRVSYAGRLSRLRSVTLLPARDLSLASLITRDNPALLTSQGTLLSDKEVSGESFTPEGGDRTQGHVVSAELSAAPIRLDSPDGGNSTQFVVPLPSKPAGAVLKADLGGLDPASWIEVAVNDRVRGVLSPSQISLNAPETVLGSDGKILLAGWHHASLFLPATLWQEGENSVTLTLHRANGDPGNPLHLRAVRLDLLFGADSASGEITSSKSSASPTPSASPSSSPSTDAEKLSNGSVYGNPSPGLFRSAAPAPTAP